jgi:hypothetical protein
MPCRAHVRKNPFSGNCCLKALDLGKIIRTLAVEKEERMSHDKHYKLVSGLKPGRIALPVLIGLAVVGWFIVKEIDTDAMSQIRFTWNSVFWLFVA